MEQETLDRLRATLTEWERGNFAAGAELLSPDVTTSAFIPDGMVVSHGWDELARFMREIFSQWGHYRIEVEDLVGLDDSTVLMEGRQYGTGKASGVEIADSLHIVFEFEGGRGQRHVLASGP